MSRLTETERAFLRHFAASAGIAGEIETEEDLEAALGRALGFDRFTEEWATDWFAALRQRGKGMSHTRVVQNDTSSLRDPKLPQAPKTQAAKRHP